jgi:hypothetical protein
MGCCASRSIPSAFSATHATRGSIREGALADTDGTLSRLIGRPTTPLADGLRSLV